MGIRKPEDNQDLMINFAIFMWMQQGSQSDAALAFCGDNGIEAVSKRCILMFAEPVGF